MPAASDAYATPSQQNANGVVVVSLGRAEVTSTHEAAGVTIQPLLPPQFDPGRPDLYDAEQEETALVAIDAGGVTYFGQRAAVITRAQAIVVGGRPSAQAEHPMYSSTYVEVGVDAVIDNLTGNALSENLGSDLRWVGNPAKFSNPITTFYELQPSVPNVATDELVIDYVDSTAPAPSIETGFAYSSRAGVIIRPALNLEGCVTQWGTPGAKASTFTWALVAMIHEGEWSFNDLLGVSSKASNPAGATDCVIRYGRDDIELYVANQRLCDHKINRFAATVGAQASPVGARPSIIVWSVDAAGKTSLVVYTPHTTFLDTMTFKAQKPFSLPFYIGTPGNPLYNVDTGGFNGGYNNGLSRIEILDLAYWTDALDLPACEQTASVLDQVYGVRR